MEETLLRNGADVISDTEKPDGAVTHISRVLRTAIPDLEIGHEYWSETCDVCGLATGDQCRPSCRWEPHIVIFAMK